MPWRSLHGRHSRLLQASEGTSALPRRDQERNGTVGRDGARGVKVSGFFPPSGNGTESPASHGRVGCGSVISGSCSTRGLVFPSRGRPGVTPPSSLLPSPRRSYLSLAGPPPPCLTPNHAPNRPATSTSRAPALPRSYSEALLPVPLRRAGAVLSPPPLRLTPPSGRPRLVDPLLGSHLVEREKV